MAEKQRTKKPSKHYVSAELIGERATTEIMRLMQELENAPAWDKGRIKGLMKLASWKIKTSDATCKVRQQQTPKAIGFYVLEDGDVTVLRINNTKMTYRGLTKGRVVKCHCTAVLEGKAELIYRATKQRSGQPQDHPSCESAR